MIGKQQGIAAVVIIGIVVASVAGVFFQFHQRYTLPIPTLVADTTFTVHSGESLTSIGTRFQQVGWVDYPFFFKVYLNLLGISTNIKVGEYIVPAESSVLDVLQVLVAGRTRLYPITFIAGSKMDDVLTLLRNHPNIDFDLPQQVTDQNAHLTRLLGKEFSVSVAEGLVLAETFLFAKQTKASTVLKQANAALQQYLTKHWRVRDVKLPFANKYEVLTMASIIEKETGLPSERATISGVFVRRLRKKMKLQTDPTVIYGLGDAFTGNLRRKHLQMRSPYNTYVHFGLPPSPISIVGEAAIYAALHPDLTDDALFFVAKGDGSHYFSSSYTEHQRAVNQYQKRKVKNYTSWPQ